ncbi:MAG: hypothetical protein WA982_17685 [Rubrobacteraceae bacterium]
MNVPFTDMWRMPPYFDKFFSGSLTVADLWALHSGEHRPLLPRVFLLAMGKIASFDMLTIMYATQLCLLVIFGGIFLAYRDTVGSDTKLLFLAIPISLLVFTLSQYWNMLNAWSIHVVVVNSFVVLSFLLLSRLGVGSSIREKSPLFLAAILGGSAATLSAGHGLMIWPVGFIQLLLEPISSRSKKYLLGVWGFIGALHWIFYFRNFENPNFNNPSARIESTYFFDSPMLGADFFLGLIGFSFFSNPRLAIIVGTLILIPLFIVVFRIVRNREQAKYTFWISLSVFSLLVLAATTVGRAGKGLEGTVQSKYVTFSVLLALGVYVMVLKLALDTPSFSLYTVLAGACVVLIAVSTPLSYYSSVLEAREIRVEREEKVCVLYNYESLSDETLQKTFKPLRNRPEIGKEIRVNATILDDLDYTVFSLTASEIKSKFGCVQP